MSALDKIISALAPEVVPLIVKLVGILAKSPDPKAAASRALEEATRGAAFDAALRKRSKKR
jgi:hypothetical protein